MDTKPAEDFMDKNFNFINLLLFASLYIVCFVYLLQDTVISMAPKFSEAIGMFIGEAIFFIILLVLAKYQATTDNSNIIWIILIIAGLTQVASGGIIVHKFNTMREKNGDINKLTVNLSEKFIALLKGDVRTSLLCLFFIPGFILLFKNYIPNMQNSDIVNMLFIVTFTSFALLICLGVMINNESPNIKTATEYFNNYKSLLISSITFMIAIISINSIYSTNFAIPLLLAVVTIIVLIMLFTSILLLNSGYRVNKNAKNTKPSNKLSSKTIPALIFICIFHIFFTFFVSFIISKKISSGLNLLLKLSWGSVFITTIFQIISLFMVIISYKHFDDNFISKGIDQFTNSEIIKKELKDYNNLFVSVITIVIVFVAILLKDHNNLNGKDNVLFEPYLYSIFIILICVAILSMSSEMVKISNDFLNFKKKIGRAHV